MMGLLLLAHHGTAITPDSSLAERSVRGLQNPGDYHHVTPRAACNERLLMLLALPMVGGVVVLVMVRSTASDASALHEGMLMTSLD